MPRAPPFHHFLLPSPFYCLNVKMVKKMVDSFACSSCCVFGGEPLRIMMIAGGINGDSWTVEFCQVLVADSVH
ncbi:hypothetical protein Patl1_10580 [Pistacia atlantica]|uniref:Uncharacterized protein n=1 Tax=Pistacia atlantica TaxID=434234 RepID=A0ACC1A9J5_9ROSI|nr:hypothetical protein Patl1_10580 [Pistacia atlantica]